jgi:hypothetical protein
MCSGFQLATDTSSSVAPLASCMNNTGGAPFVYVTSRFSNLPDRF